MDWGNCIIRKIHKDAASGIVTAIDADLHLEGDFKTTKWKLTWLAQVWRIVWDEGIKVLRRESWTGYSEPCGENICQN